MSRRVGSIGAFVVSLGLVLAACGGQTDEPRDTAEPVVASTPTATPEPEPTPTPTPAEPAEQVLAISVDGLNPEALTRLGRKRTPTFHRLLTEGAVTLNARTAVEMTVTLPNHTGMLTGRRISASRGGHGVTWNVDRRGAVVPGRGRGVKSVFDVVAKDGGTSALFSGKGKFRTFDRSWPITRTVIDDDLTRLVRKVRRDLRRHDRELTFVHIALPDLVGHARGFMTRPYLRAVQEVDRALARVLGELADEEKYAVVLTADHGGARSAREHSDRRYPENFTVPFIVWGPDVAAGDLYERNPARREPGYTQPSYRGRQPIRNADLANVVAGLLDLRPVPGSTIGVRDPLVVRQ